MRNVKYDMLQIVVHRSKSREVVRSALFPLTSQLVFNKSWKHLYPHALAPKHVHKAHARVFDPLTHGTPRYPKPSQLIQSRIEKLLRIFKLCAQILRLKHFCRSIYGAQRSTLRVPARVERSVAREEPYLIG